LKGRKKITDETKRGDNELTKDTNDIQSNISSEDINIVSREEESGNMIAELEKKLDLAEAQSGEYLDMLKRKAAEFENYKRRTAKERDSLSCEITGSVISKFLDLADNLDSAVENVRNEKKGPLKDGLNLIYRQMQDILKNLDVQVIEAVGNEFDPNIHFALLHVEDENVGENIVVEELKKGYMYKGKVIRHSMVKVAN